MGRPINKRVFSANENNNIKVQFFNGTDSVPGFIVKQAGSKSFICQDALGNKAKCKLVNKTAATLVEGEMTISLKQDNGTIVHPVKITNRYVTLDTGDRVLWNFSTSTVDSVAEIEEAGTDTVLTGATDLEGDETEI